MQTEQKNDVNLRVLGTGCVASLGTGCIGVIFILILAFIFGAETARNSWILILFGFFIGSAVVTATGYFVTRAAQKHRVAVNFHIIIYGIILMVIDLLGFITTKKSLFFRAQMFAIFNLVHLIRWMLTIPLMLLGASWTKAKEII